MTAISARELKKHLSEFLRRIAAGERITVTDRGRPVAILSPPDAPAEHDAIVGMVREGVAAWDGSKPRGATRPARIRGESLSSTVLGDRR